MRHSRHAILAFGFLVASVAPLQADDKEAQALVAKAIKAHGGAETLAKFTGTVAKFKGKFHGMGQAIDMTGKVSAQGADKLKQDISLEDGGQALQIVTVLDGDKGWIVIGDNTMDLDKDQVAETREQAHSAWLTTLTPLTDKGLTLATTGEVLVNEKPALGVKVSAKDRRDVTLYFDKETGLLVKYESTVKDQGTGQEVTEEEFLSEYKEVQGTKQAMKLTTKRDGKLYAEAEITDYKLVDKLGADVFAKP